jgi:hypothetical protein
MMVDTSEMKRFEMTPEQHTKLLEACKPTPMIMLQCGTPRSPQESANSAWKVLGDELGFDHMTARPIAGEPETVFEAKPARDES